MEESSEGPQGITGHHLSRSEHFGSALSSFIILANCNDSPCINVSEDACVEERQRAKASYMMQFELISFRVLKQCVHLFMFVGDGLMFLQ